MAAPAGPIGKVLGGYLIQAQVGAGGMGVVYKALDERGGRTVAIKVLPAKFRKDETLRQRFLREGRTAARIDHPNVARILSAGEENGIPYLVMEYVDGGSLQRIIDKQVRFPMPTALRIFRQLAEALAAAHRVGVLHRDVKPANVLFSKEGEPKLVDFGLAREEFSDQSLSQTGMVMGTPHYMAPEVCAGKEASIASDIYALGIVAYYTIALRLPFDDEGAVAILMKHVSEPAPPLTEAPGPVAAVIARALIKDKAKRWGSAADFAAALGALERGVPLPPEESGSKLTAVGKASGTRPPSVKPAEVTSAVTSSPAHLPATPGTPGLLPGAPTPTGGILAVDRPSRRPILIAAALLATVVAVAATAVAFRGKKNDGAAQPQPTPDATPEKTDPDLPVGPSDKEIAAAEAWTRELQGIRAEAAVLEGSNNIRGAVAAWARAKPPDLRGRALVVAEIRALEGRAAGKAEMEIAEAKSGAAGARHLRTLAETMPHDVAAKLLAAAARIESNWVPTDGLAALPRAVRTLGLEGMDARLGTLSAEESPELRDVLEAARAMVAGGKRTMELARIWYQAAAGSSVLLQLKDGSELAGQVAGVELDGRFLRIDIDGVATRVAISDLAIPEILFRASAGTPSEADLHALFDGAALLGERGDCWRVASQLNRRMISVESREKGFLDESLSGDELRQIGLLERKMGQCWRDPEAAGRTSREFLAGWGAAPAFPQRRTARDLMVFAGGKATAADLLLFSSAYVTESRSDVILEWPRGDSILSDLNVTGAWAITPGSALEVSPIGRSCYAEIAGLDYQNVRVVLEIQTESRFGIVAGSRNPYERISAACSPGKDGEFRLVTPVRGKETTFRTDPSGRINLEFTIAGDLLTVRANDATVGGTLPARWAGSVGLFFTGPATVLRLEVTGAPEFRAHALDDEFAELSAAQDRVKPDKWKSIRLGQWTAARTEAESVDLAGGEVAAWAAPQKWVLGDDWSAQFMARLDARGELQIDLRCAGGARRRVILRDDEGQNGLQDGEAWQSIGHVRGVPRETNLHVLVAVHDDLATVDVDGNPVWFGHLGPAVEGGLELGARFGTVHIENLRLAPIPRRR